MEIIVGEIGQFKFAGHFSMKLGHFMSITHLNTIAVAVDSADQITHHWSSDTISVWKFVFFSFSFHWFEKVYFIN